MASSGVSEIQPLGNLMQERVSRELARENSSSPSLDEKKESSSKEDVAISSVPYDTEKTKGSLDDGEFEPYDIHTGEPFPESDMPEEEGSGFTWRAVLIGQALGLVIAASNVYLGEQSDGRHLAEATKRGD
jgi:hypothetical protein